MERKNIAAFTEATNESYPGFVSINREPDGRYVLTVRERGHGGEKMVTLELPIEALYDLARDTLNNMRIPSEV